MDKIRNLLCMWFNLVPKEDVEDKDVRIQQLYTDIDKIIDGDHITKAHYMLIKELEKALWHGRSIKE